MGITAYKQVMKATADPRQIEYRLFQNTTSKLRDFKGKQGFWEVTPEMKEALWENQRLWNALRSDLVQPDNGLPRELRAQLLSLAAFIDKHTARVLSGEQTLDAIVEINEAIMQGLAPAAQQPAEVAAELRRRAMSLKIKLKPNEKPATNGCVEPNGPKRHPL